MNIENNSIIKIETNSENVLTKLQKQFNAYTSKIERLKREILDTQYKIDQAKKLVVEELYPVEKQILRKSLETLEILDRQHNGEFFKKAEKKLISEIIISNAENLMLEFENEEAVIFYTKYSGITLEQYNELAELEEKEMLKNYAKVFNIDIDQDFDTADEFQEHINSRLNEKVKNNFSEDGNKKKKTKTQIEREEMKKQEDQNIIQSARKIYMDLIKEFHPDRETDEAEKNRKTAIIQEVTEAYQNKDLFKLIKLQFDYLPIEKDSLNNIPDEKLKYFNKILKGQVDNLEMELYKTRGDIYDTKSFYSRYCADKNIAEVFKYEKKKLKSTLKKVSDQAEFFRDKDELKIFLKEYRSWKQ